MIGLAPIPNAIVSVTASVISNMVLPLVNGDFLQVGRDDVQSVLDEAQHVAMFKIGGAEFIETFPLHQNFLRHCALYNSKLKALSPWLEFIDGRSMEDDRENPQFTEPNPATVK
jgi:hypothetical protein